MYSVIIAIHAVFILLSHFLGYRFFEGIFLILGIFFLFYFSPLFFLDDEKKKTDHSFSRLHFQNIVEKFSPKDSLILPLSLLYIAIYGFVISAFGSVESFFSIHSILSLGIFLILFGYILSFDTKNDMFTEVFYFHTSLSFITTILFGGLSFFEFSQNFFLFPLLGCVTCFGGVYTYSYARNTHPVYTSLFLGSFISTVFLMGKFLFHFDSLPYLLSILVIFGIFLFEIAPKILYFSGEKEIIRYFSLISIICSIPFLIFLTFTSLTLPFLLLVSVMIFFLSIHVRYSNYIAYGIGLFIIYFLYSLFFISLLLSSELFSVLIFIFFLPFLLISITYFWEEHFPYDFLILHYSAIAFSGIYSIYALLFIGWGGGFLFTLSSFIFGLALLFFLHFFRFRK